MNVYHVNVNVGFFFKFFSFDSALVIAVFFSVKTLSEFTNEVNKLGYIISRSGVYLRMYPKRMNTHEGKRHVKCLPIRLLRPQNNLRRENKEISMTTLLELSSANRMYILILILAYFC